MGEGPPTSGPPRKREQPAFELEAFTWGAPDRLDVAGTFVGATDVPADAPVLVVRGDGATYRLPAASGLTGPPEDGERWTATFVWQTAPVPFDAARLELGDDFAVELPQPGETGAEDRVLEVRRTSVTPESAAPDTGAGPVHLQAELLEAQQEGRELRASLQRAQEELSRARADLAAEREGRAADAARFRDGLAQVEASAEEALSERTQEASEARAEADRLRERVASLEHADKEVDELRSQLERTRTEAAGMRADLSRTRDAVEQAHAEAQRLLGRLTSIADGQDTRT